MTVVSRHAAESPRNQAEALAIGLEAGALSVGDVVAWARAVLSAQASLPVACDANKGGPYRGRNPREETRLKLDDVVAMAERTQQDVVEALRRFPGACERGVAEVLLVWRLASMVETDPSRAKALVMSLYNLGCSGVIRDKPLRRVVGEYADATFQPVNNRDVPNEPDLAVVHAALHNFIERTTSLLDPVEGTALPWLAGDR